MMVPARLRHRIGQWLSTTTAMVALVAQLGVSLSPLGEGVPRGKATVSAGAHVETGGTSAHYAHNEATCAVCQARSVQTALPRAQALVTSVAHRATSLDRPAHRLASSELRSLTRPRAPPAV
jgi:hypothetical protein